MLDMTLTRTKTHRSMKLEWWANEQSFSYILWIVWICGAFLRENVSYHCYVARSRLSFIRIDDVSTLKISHSFPICDITLILFSAPLFVSFSPANTFRLENDESVNATTFHLYAHNIREQQYNLVKFQMKTQTRNVILL